MVSGVLLLALCGAAPPPSAEVFVKALREATARYHDREAAIADGYRLIGGDFPAMGEHWINIGLLFGGHHEPDRPEFLTYVDVAGTPRLTGVAYAVPLLPGESPPAWPWAAESWHDHAGTVEEETLLLHDEHAGHAVDHGEDGAPRPRLAMAHAWIWLTNPAGDFAADNWALPYFRLGLATPAEAPLASAKALALVSGGAEHLTSVLEADGARTASERRAVRKALEHCQRSVRGILGREGRSELDPSEVRRLADVWTQLWMDLDRALPTTTRSRIRAFR
ncbi:MAG TPA: hypothetical protein VGN09_07100 [Vicinamibacteria bacterium]|jgi:hypothetical protein